MISIYKTIDGKMTKLDTVEDGCWINLIYPSEDELKTVSVILGVELPFLKAALDEEETSRIDSEDGQTLIIVDTPAMERDETGVVYSTLPMGIIVTEKHIVTVCLKETSVVRDLQDGLVKDVRTQQRTRFILNILLLVAKRYLQYLKQIDKTYNYMERQLYKSQRNKELIQLLDLEKSLVYFNTSLKANEVTLEKILRGRIVTLYEEDHDLLEDVLIEVRQAIEMAQIYSSIISGMMDAFASVISNNLNVIMKVLTSITILMTVPNIIFGYFGMNITGGLPLDQFWWVPLLMSVAIIVVLAIILKKKEIIMVCRCAARIFEMGVGEGLAPPEFPRAIPGKKRAGQARPLRKQMQVLNGGNALRTCILHYSLFILHWTHRPVAGVHWPVPAGAGDWRGRAPPRRRRRTADSWPANLRRGRR